MTPLPWLQFAPVQNPQLPQRPGLMQSLAPLVQAGLQQVQTRHSPGVNPPARKYQTMDRGEIARSAGNAANAAMGAPPPVMKRRFPNPQQQQQLDAMRY